MISAVAGTGVICRDLSTGQTETKTIRDDWLLITDGRQELTNVQRYANGTVVTVRRTTS